MEMYLWGRIYEGTVNGRNYGDGSKEAYLLRRIHGGVFVEAYLWECISFKVFRCIYEGVVAYLRWEYRWRRVSTEMYL